MGRIKEAWLTLVNRQRDPYVRTSQVNGLLAQVAEAEEALAGLYDKYNTMAARHRKREQRATTTPTGHTPDRETRRKLVNRGFLAARGVNLPEHMEVSLVNGDQTGEIPGDG